MAGNGNDIIQEIKKYTPEGYCLDNDILVVDGKGAYFKDIEGKRYLDFTSGIFTNTFGHSFPPFRL